MPPLPTPLFIYFSVGILQLTRCTDFFLDGGHRRLSFPPFHSALPLGLAASPSSASATPPPRAPLLLASPTSAVGSHHHLSGLVPPQTRLAFTGKIGLTPPTPFSALLFFWDKPSPLAVPALCHPGPYQPPPPPLLPWPYSGVSTADQPFTAPPGLPLSGSAHSHPISGGLLFPWTATYPLFAIGDYPGPSGRDTKSTHLDYPPSVPTPTWPAPPMLAARTPSNLLRLLRLDIIGYGCGTLLCITHSDVPRFHGTVFYSHHAHSFNQHASLASIH